MRGGGGVLHPCCPGDSGGAAFTASAHSGWVFKNYDALPSYLSRQPNRAEMAQLMGHVSESLSPPLPPPRPPSSQLSSQPSATATAQLMAQVSEAVAYSVNVLITVAQVGGGGVRKCGKAPVLIPFPTLYGSRKSPFYLFIT